MRVVALVLPDLALEVSSLAKEGRPLAVLVTPSSQGAVTEAELVGNPRIDAVSASARSLGVEPGQTLTAARACTSELVVRIVSEDKLERALARIAEVALAFGATSAFERGASGDDVVWVDVTGCAHLFGPAAPSTHDESTSRPSLAENEARLVSRLVAAIESLGHTCCAALAGGPRVARAVARDLHLQGREGEWVVVAGGQDGEAMRALPLAAFPLSESQVSTLARLGIRSGQELASLPRAALGARLGSAAPDVFSLIDGEDRTPLVAYKPPELLEERLELEHGTEALEALTFIVKTLTDRLALRLEGRAMGVTKLDLILELDGVVGRARASSSGKRRPKKVLAMALPTPLVHPKELFVVLRARLERAALASPVLAVTLRASHLAPRPRVALSFFEPSSALSSGGGLPLLVAELSAELGADAVGRLALGNSWLPEERTRLEPFFSRAESTEARGSHAMENHDRESLAAQHSAPEPSLLLPVPEPVERPRVNAFRFVSRVESAGWWRSSVSRDYVAATVDARPAYVEIDRTTNRARILGWLD